jgi:hypothetical protein
VVDDSIEQKLNVRSKCNSLPGAAVRFRDRSTREISRRLLRSTSVDGWPNATLRPSRSTAANAEEASPLETSETLISGVEKTATLKSAS